MTGSGSASVCWKVTFSRVRMQAVTRSQSQSLKRRNESGTEIETERRTGTGTVTGAEVGLATEVGAGTEKREKGTGIMREDQTGTRREGGKMTGQIEDRRREGVGTRYPSRKQTSSG